MSKQFYFKQYRKKEKKKEKERKKEKTPPPKKKRKLDEKEKIKLKDGRYRKLGSLLNWKNLKSIFRF